MRISEVAIVQETENWIALNKAAHLLTIPNREQSEISLKELLWKKYGEIFTVHRLDKETSGLVLFAKNAETHKYLSAQFQERKVGKTYLGIVTGLPSPALGEIKAPIIEHPVQKGKMMVHRSGKPSHTSYEVIEGFPQYSLVSFQLHTGRTHQIRVHSKEIGHPLACDPLYGDGKPVFISGIRKNYKLNKSELNEQPMIRRLALHSWKLSFTDQEGNLVDLIAEMPKEFRALINQLKKAR